MRYVSRQYNYTMTKYNFETRELVPYREDWNRGGNVSIKGALWYIKEKDGIYLKIDDDKIVGKLHFTHDFRVAKGFSAALLAMGAEVLRNIEFNALECYHAYCKEMEPLFPERPANYVHFILEDWEETLHQTWPLFDNPCGYIDLYARTIVGGIIRDLFNPFNTAGIGDKINSNFYYICHFQSQTEPQVIGSHMPNVEEMLAAPVIYKRGLNQSPKNTQLQASGFLAAIINLAICNDWQKRWSKYNFADIHLIRRINKAYKSQTFLLDVANIKELSFDLPEEVETLCRTYMNVFFTTMSNVWKRNPKVQFECIEGDNIYTYIYAHEVSALEDLAASELYSNLTNFQKQSLLSYGRRFMEWMEKTYPITMETQQKVMRAMGKDIPPIQLTIQNDVQIIRSGKEEKEEPYHKPFVKFAFIISDDKNEILKIHKRIELYLSSPAQLRDELRRLQNEGLVALPMENPTQILRELQRVWGDKAPKLGSFKTTWGRVKC